MEKEWNDNHDVPPGSTMISSIQNVIDEIGAYIAKINRRCVVLELSLPYFNGPKNAKMWTQFQTGLTETKMFVGIARNMLREFFLNHHEDLSLRKAIQCIAHDYKNVVTFHRKVLEKYIERMNQLLLKFPPSSEVIYYAMQEERNEIEMALNGMKNEICNAENIIDLVDGWLNFNEPSDEEACQITQNEGMDRGYSKMEYMGGIMKNSFNASEVGDETFDYLSSPKAALTKFTRDELVTLALAKETKKDGKANTPSTSKPAQKLKKGKLTDLPANVKEPPKIAGKIVRPSSPGPSKTMQKSTVVLEKTKGTAKDVGKNVIPSHSKHAQGKGKPTVIFEKAKEPPEVSGKAVPATSSKPASKSKDVMSGKPTVASETVKKIPKGKTAASSKPSILLLEERRPNVADEKRKCEDVPKQKFTADVECDAQFPDGNPANYGSPLHFPITSQEVVLDWYERRGVDICAPILPDDKGGGLSDYDRLQRCVFAYHEGDFTFVYLVMKVISILIVAMLLGIIISCIGMHF